MKRRDFFRQVGIGSAALVSLPGLAHALTRPAEATDDDNERPINFHLVSFSGAATIDGVAHQILLSGGGKFDEEEVEGQGGFNHFDNASAVPKAILASGAWRAKEFISFAPVGGRWGAVVPGILQLKVDLLPDQGRRVRGVFLKIVCNAPPGGLFTGEPEGFTLTIPGAPFGTFTPLNPTLGLTLFTAPNRGKQRI